ncbi:MAG: extensin family protein [Bacteroidota bacterium]
MALKKVNSVSGIPLHYARTTAHPYGTRGVRTTFRMTKDFYATLKACFDETFAACPLGKPEVMTSAGAFVDKPGSHGRGEAFDIDGLFWSDYSMMTLNFPTNVELYLGIESFLRRHFGIVLNYEYNRAHEDHWHIDTSVSTSYSKRSRSKTLYLQLTLKHIYGQNVVIDGIYGPQTRGAYNRIMEQLGQPEGMRKAEWLNYLKLTGHVAFRLFEEKTSPRNLFANAYEIAGQQTGVAARRLMEALNTFRDHPETTAWLGEMKTDEEILAEVIREVVDVYG